MSAIYTTSDGDTVDEIAFKYYGTLDGRTAEKVLEANRGLSDYGPLLPAGVEITLPDIAPSATSKSVRLWT